MKIALMGLALLAAASAAAQAPAAAEPQGFVDLFKASTQAYEAKDYKRMEQFLRAALKQRPAHPRASYNLAAALALGGQKNAALKELRKLERMGLSYDIGADEDFAGMREWEGFKELRRAFARNGRRAGEAEETFRLALPTFIPEGLAWDDKRDEFLLGSVHERRIVRVDEDGKQAPFSRAGESWAVLGLVADSRKRRLWAATAALAEMKDARAEEIGRTAILAYDLDSGELKRRYDLPDDGRRHALGDITLGRDGRIFASDSVAGEVYQLDPESGRYTALGSPGTLSSPQGISADSRALYIADYAQGLFRYDFRDRTLKRLEVAEDICVYGIDGIYRFGEDLIAIQNGIRPHRVVRFALDRGGKRVRHAAVQVAAQKDFDQPTLGVLVGRTFHFVANSQWERFDANQRLPPAEQLRGPVVLNIPIERRRRNDDQPQGRPLGPEQQPQQGLSLPPLPGL
jgi:sugar lactone lactonase YvrE